MFRRRREREREASARLDARWQRFVDAATAVRTDFAAILADATEGPLRQRLEQMADTLARQVDEAAAIATEADQLDQAVRRLDPDAVTAAYKQARRSSPDGDARLASLAAQHATVNRMLNTVETTEERLDLAVVRLRELLVRGTEIVLARSQDAADTLGDDLASVGVELAALHAALSDVDAGR